MINQNGTMMFVTYSIAFNKDVTTLLSKNSLSSASSNLCSYLRCSCHSKYNSGLDYDYLLCPKISISVLGNTKPNLISVAQIRFLGFRYPIRDIWYLSQIRYSGTNRKLRLLYPNLVARSPNTIIRMRIIIIITDSSKSANNRVRNCS